MAYEGSESAQGNFGKFIHQFPPETKTLIRKLERILIKDKMCLYYLNETCLNEQLLPNYTHKHTHIYIYIYIYIYINTLYGTSVVPQRH